jgi:hypothetical protein
MVTQVSRLAGRIEWQCEPCRWPLSFCFVGSTRRSQKAAESSRMIPGIPTTSTVCRPRSANTSLKSAKGHQARSTILQPTHRSKNVGGSTLNISNARAWAGFVGETNVSMSTSLKLARAFGSPQNNIGTAASETLAESCRDCPQPTIRRLFRGRRSVQSRLSPRRSSSSRASRIVRNLSGRSGAGGSVRGTRRDNASPAQTSATPIAMSEIARAVMLIYA